MTATPRRGCVLNYMVDGTRVADGSQPLLRGVAPIPVGDPVDGARVDRRFGRAADIIGGASGRNARLT